MSIPLALQYSSHLVGTFPSFLLFPFPVSPSLWSPGKSIWSSSRRCCTCVHGQGTVHQHAFEQRLLDAVCSSKTDCNVSESTQREAKIRKDYNGLLEISTPHNTWHAKYQEQQEKQKCPHKTKGMKVKCLQETPNKTWLLSLEPVALLWGTWATKFSDTFCSAYIRSKLLSSAELKMEYVGKTPLESWPCLLWGSYSIELSKRDNKHRVVQVATSASHLAS